MSKTTKICNNSGLVIVPAKAGGITHLIIDHCAPRIFEVLKEEEIKRCGWPEGDISYREWVEQTFGQKGLDILDHNEKSSI